MSDKFIARYDYKLFEVNAIDTNRGISFSDLIMAKDFEEVINYMKNNSKEIKMIKVRDNVPVCIIEFSRNEIIELYRSLQIDVQAK